MYLFFPTGLQAVPSFARNLGLDCNSCHTAYPQLNEFGKIFLETGGEILIQKDFGMMTMTPEIVSGHISLLPIDKSFSADSTTKLTKKDKQFNLSAFAEVNAYLAGRIGKLFYFTVFAASNEWGSSKREGFDARFEEGFVSYNMLNNNLNVFAGYDSPFITDGNDTIAHHQVFERQWKAAEYTPETSQMVGFNGMNGNFYWIAAWQGAVESFQGTNPKGYSLRASYNVHHQTMGVYFSRGFEFDKEIERSVDPFSFYGLDCHFRFKNTNILTLLGFRKLHEIKQDWDFSVEANSIFTIENPSVKNYLSTIIPMVNVDFFQDRTLSTGKWVQGSLGVMFYVNPGVRIFPQFSGTLLSPTEYKHRNCKFLISIDVGL